MLIRGIYGLLSFFGILELRTILVRIDGNIASGKSTLIQYLAQVRACAYRLVCLDPGRQTKGSFALR